MNFRVITVDPGKITGWCVIEEDEEKHPDKGFKILTHGTNDTETLVQTLVEIVGWYVPTTLIYEDVVMTGRMNEDKRVQIENLGRVLGLVDHPHHLFKQCLSVTPQAVKNAAKSAPPYLRPNMVTQHEKDAYWIWYSVRGYLYA